MGVMKNDMKRGTGVGGGIRRRKSIGMKNGKVDYWCFGLGHCTRPFQNVWARTNTGYSLSISAWCL
jgi:hypothetical protein